MFKKILSLVVCLCMLLGLVATTALAGGSAVSDVSGVSASYVEFTDGINVITNLPELGTVQANIKVSNSNDVAQNVVFTVCVYTNGVIVDAKFVKQSIPANTKDFPLSVTVTGVSTENTVLKAFITNGFLTNHTIAYKATFPSSDRSLQSFKVDGVQLKGCQPGGEYTIFYPRTKAADPQIEVVASDNATSVHIPAVSVPGVVPVEVKSADGVVDVYTLKMKYEAGSITNIVSKTTGTQPIAVDNLSFTGSEPAFVDRSTSKLYPSSGPALFTGASYIRTTMDDKNNADYTGETLIKDWMSFNISADARIYYVIAGGSKGWPHGVSSGWTQDTETQMLFPGSSTTNAKLWYKDYKAGRVEIPNLGTAASGDAASVIVVWDYDVPAPVGATLSALTCDVTDAVWSPAFDSATTTYNVQLPAGTSSVSLTGTPETGGTVGYTTQPLTSFPGSITATATAPGKTATSYTVNFTVKSGTVSKTITNIVSKTTGAQPVAVDNLSFTGTEPAFVDRSTSKLYPSTGPDIFRGASYIRTTMGDKDNAAYTSTTLTKDWITFNIGADARIYYVLGGSSKGWPHGASSGWTQDTETQMLFPGSTTTNAKLWYKDYKAGSKVEIPNLGDAVQGDAASIIVVWDYEAAPKSDNANLASLGYKVDDGATTAITGFAADTLNYSITADAGKKITLDAVKEDGKASVAYSPNEVTVPGDDTAVTIKAIVTAENGTTEKEYVVTVKKTDSASVAGAVTNVTSSAAATAALTYAGRTTPTLSTTKLAAGVQLYSDRTDDKWAAAHITESLLGADYVMTPLYDVRKGDSEFLNGTDDYFTFDINKACTVYVLSPFEMEANYADWTKESGGKANSVKITIDGKGYWSGSNLRPVDDDKNPTTPGFYLSSRQNKADKGVVTPLINVYSKTFAEAGTVTIKVPGKKLDGTNSVDTSKNPDNMVVVIVWE